MAKGKAIYSGWKHVGFKRPDLWLPDHWPTYYSKASGCHVWDLDGNCFTDVAIMGIGTNVLGYCNPEVDKAVQSAVANGNMSTFNCPEEVQLAEHLVDLHSWADMVRLARSGGEANAISVRIARAASGRNKVAICGYHGWHDWYLAANLADAQHLDGHILPGLDPLGVPRNLGGSVIPFNYNDIDRLREIAKDPDLGVVKMEVVRDQGPNEGFLESVRSLCNENGIVLIFDECTSGFRETLGGIHKRFGVEPDIATFGKALGNGYAISAIVGRRNVMESAQDTFISSTFWTERIGPTAALKQLKYLREKKSQKLISEIGSVIKTNWQRIADDNSLPIVISGISAIPNYKFDVENNLLFKTVVTQLMLDKGYLATPLVYVSVKHNEKILDGYFDALNEVFQLMKKTLEEGSLDKLVKGRICDPNFKRLNPNFLTQLCHSKIKVIIV